MNQEILNKIQLIGAFSEFLQTHSYAAEGETDLEYDVREFFYQLTGVINEFHQGLTGGYFDTDYINEKLSMMCAYADHIKREELPNR